MTPEIWKAVDQYLGQSLLPADAALDAALADSAGLPAINVSPLQGRFLQILALLQNARSILELGTLGGYSTIWLGRTLPPGGRLLSLEINPAHARIAQANIERAGLSDRVEIRVGAALELLPQLEAGAYDLVFIDADKPNVPAYFTWAIKLSRPGGLIIVDNVMRKGAVIDANSEDPNVHGMRRLIEMLATETRVTATALQTVGSKGYDGLLLARVNG